MSRFLLSTSSYIKDTKNNGRVPFQIQKFARLSLVSLNIHPRSRRGVERIGQGEGRWSRPPKTALERRDLTEKFQFGKSHTEAETKETNSLTSPSPQKTRLIVYMYGYIPSCAGGIFFGLAKHMIMELHYERGVTAAVDA